jgi:Calcineurin-like phosphoesterase
MSNAMLVLVQLSDLHIGEIDPQTGDAQVSKIEALFYSNCSWLDGVLGHHGRALEDVAQFLQDLKKAGETPHLVITGDLTRIGNSNEFDNAIAFFTTGVDIRPPHGNYVCLQCNDWRTRTIPGNHDHWPGRPVVFGKPDPSFFKCFYPKPDSLPYTRQVWLPNGRLLRLIGINTDADVSPNGHQRLRAVGSFQTQLAAVAPMLGPLQQREIRVLLMHHSWHRQGPLLCIDRGTRASLERFLVDHNVRLVLTGHTHKALLQHFVPNVRGAASVLECRSGTTTQIDQVPYAWRNLLGSMPKARWPSNTLLVHRLYDQGGSVRWDVQVLVRFNHQGFVPVSPGGSESIII